MKYQFIIIAILAFSSLKAQVYYDNNEVNKNSSAIGETNVSSGNSSFASGINSSATGSSSHAFGLAVEASNNSAFALGAYNTASGAASIVIGSRSIASGTGAIAIGNKVNATFPFSYVIGMGTTSQSLINNIGNSLMIGFNSTKPTFFVSRNETTQPDGLGKIGIGTITPGSLLQVNGATAMGYDAATIAPANGLLVSGNTGIGTATVGSKLQVNGNAAIGYSSSTAAPANGLLISGNLGIGTTAATTTEKLTVDGNIALVSSDNGIILKSPDGSNWKLTVDNSGNIITTKITAVNEISPNISNVEIYPNPAKDEVQIKLNNTYAALSIAVELRTMENMLMYYQVFNQKEIVINIQSFTAGSYVVLIKDNNGKVLKNSVLIKQ